MSSLRIYFLLVIYFSVLSESKPCNLSDVQTCRESLALCLPFKYNIQFSAEEKHDLLTSDEHDFYITAHHLTVALLALNFMIVHIR